MSGFTRLLSAGRNLESQLHNSVVGAVSYTAVENLTKRDTEWENIITNKLNDIKLLNSKAILLNTTLQKENVIVNNIPNADEAKLRLTQTIDTHSRWSNALKTKAISRVVYTAYKNNDEEKLEIFRDLLQKLADSDNTLRRLNEIEALKNKELNEISKRWKHTAEIWNKKKKSEEEKNMSNRTADNSNILEINLHRRIHKIEILKTIQSRLLGSSINYDWIKDMAKLDKYLVMTRKPPFKPEDFL